MDIIENEDVSPKKRDILALLDRLEITYLAALRVAALVIATLLLIYAGWLGLSGLYNISRSADSIKEEPVSIAAEEITKIDLQSSAQKRQGDAPDPLKQQRAFYDAFQKRYFALYQSKFAPFLQKDDAKISAGNFDGKFIHHKDRLDEIRQGDLNFQIDKPDLEALLSGMTAAADVKVSQDRLKAYRGAKKIMKSRTVTDMRSERYCSYYGYYIDQCISWGTREVPVKRTVTEMSLPEGVISPNDLFAAYHDQYVSTLISRRKENAQKAESAKAEITRGNAVGFERIWTATKVVGFFVVLMFLFLVIALERHQRAIAKD